MSLLTHIAAIDLQLPRLREYQPFMAKVAESRRKELVRQLAVQFAEEMEIQVAFNQQRAAVKKRPIVHQCQVQRCQNCQRLSKKRICDRCKANGQDFRL